MTIRILSAFFALLLAGCASERSANNENFSKAINAVLHRQKLCIEHKAFVFPLTLSVRDKKNTSLLAILNSLHEAGLLSRMIKNKKIPVADLSLRYERAYYFELTGPGYKASSRIQPKNRKSPRRFCYARPHAAAVEKFSKPETAQGRTRTRVTFHYSLTQVAPWARKKILLEHFPDLKRNINTLTRPRRKQATLELGKERWILVDTIKPAR